MRNVAIFNIYNLCKEISKYKPNKSAKISPSSQSFNGVFLLKPTITPNAGVLFEIVRYLPKAAVESICFVKGKDLSCNFYKFLNNIKQILLFDYENCTLYGYTMEKVNKNLVEIKIVKVDLCCAQESIIFNFLIGYFDKNPESDPIETLYISALNQRHLLIITPNIPHYPTKIAKIIDIESKEEIPINPYLFEEHDIFEIADLKVIQKHKNKKYILIKTGRICSFEKRNFYNSHSNHYKDKIETLIVAPVEDVLDEAISQKKIDFSKYIIATAGKNQTVEFESFINVDNILASITATNLPFILYSKENFSKGSIEIFKFDLENKATYKLISFGGKKPFIYCDDKGYFFIEANYSDLSNSNLQKLALEKIYLENDQRTKVEIIIEEDEIFENLYSCSSASFITTKNVLKEEIKVYFLDEKESYFTTKFYEGFVPIFNTVKDEIKAFIIYPYYVINR
ncbi:hypothetical protein [Caldicellulosiruptor naganoensis]|uniref:Uncharacterized protein n=1 Tax=Caldicellulosiruptor naganoensis TaxID=29324 RepID=A0ABY7BFU0_9FIRM|nr:hypothetical protein [Caldicellulosiruptor naganoensis]WAM31692.1 hypothetical protein OTJ99_000125 [Caldicellulosiruptor naganoensis]